MKIFHPIYIAAPVLLVFVTPALASEPNIQTPSPVIYLADNLDEKDQLGWCIDTLGRGFSEELQVHSCKPQGGDVQFAFDEASGQIRSVEFENKCATLSNTDDAAVPFGLLDCEDGNAAQQFTYDPEAMTFSPKGDESMCLAGGELSRTAGPFMSRDLTLVACEGADASLTRWVIKP